MGQCTRPFDQLRAQSLLWGARSESKLSWNANLRAKSILIRYAKKRPVVALLVRLAETSIS